MKNIIVIGAGGLAREAFDMAHSCLDMKTAYRFKGFLSDFPSDIEQMGYPPVLDTVDGYSPTKDDVFFCAIGNVHDRKKTVEKILARGGTFINLIHPTAIISPSASIGNGVAVKPYCVISNDVKIGDHNYLQSSVIMGHDVRIGNFCQLNSFSFLAGNVIVHDQVTINAGARIIQSVVVEDSAVVGMGSVVLNRVKKGTTVFGSPAKRVQY